MAVIFPQIVNPLPLQEIAWSLGISIFPSKTRLKKLSSKQFLVYIFPPISELEFDCVILISDFCLWIIPFGVTWHTWENEGLACK